MIIENKLEIVIITYNRCGLLEKTLNSFLNSPFKNCKITILNNCSTDATIEICNSFLGKFLNFKIITNKFNIGGDANIMRTIEMVNLDYIWIVCDDDEYDFSYCDDIIDCIVNCKVDILNIGAHSEDKWKFGGKFKSVKTFVNEGYPFFKASSFIPNNIFKLNKFLPFILAGYKNISNMYPHMPYLLSNYTCNNMLYISKNRIVTAGRGAQAYNYNDCVEGWLNTSILLKNRSDIRKCFFNQWGSVGFFNEIKSCLVIFVVAIGGNIYFKTFKNAFFLLSIFQKWIFIFMFTPYVLYRSFHKIKDYYFNSTSF
jgi:glycosyltransferase involved in cell wall biosynthesis